MVPRQFIELLKRDRWGRLRCEHGPAMIVAAIISRGAKRAVDPTKFMPSYIAPKREAQEMNWQAKMLELRSVIEGAGA